MTHAPQYETLPPRRDDRLPRGAGRGLAVVTLVISLIAAAAALVALFMVLDLRGAQTADQAPATTGQPVATPSQAPGSTPAAEPAQPRTRAAAREAAAAAFDLYTAGQYGQFWDTWTQQAQRLISRKDYVRRFKLCPAAAEGLAFTISSVSVSGNTASVVAKRSIATFTFTFAYQGGAWRYVPPADQQREYRTKTVEQIVASERAQGACA